MWLLQTIHGKTGVIFGLPLEDIDVKIAIQNIRTVIMADQSRPSEERLEYNDKQVCWSDSQIISVRNNTESLIRSGDILARIVPETVAHEYRVDTKVRFGLRHPIRDLVFFDTRHPVYDVSHSFRTMNDSKAMMKQT